MWSFTCSGHYVYTDRRHASITLIVGRTRIVLISYSQLNQDPIYVIFSLARANCLGKYHHLDRDCHAYACTRRLRPWRQNAGGPWDLMISSTLGIGKSKPISEYCSASDLTGEVLSQPLWQCSRKSENGVSDWLMIQPWILTILGLTHQNSRSGVLTPWKKL
jgi:hypothetical protein